MMIHYGDEERGTWFMFTRLIQLDNTQYFSVYEFLGSDLF